MTDFRLHLPDDNGIIGTLDENGILTFVVLAEKGSPIRGSEMFDLMMRAFGDKVRAIRGVWRRGFQGGQSVNLDKVNELTSGGTLVEKAIEQTWTARQAAKWGFSRMRLGGQPEGDVGTFTKMDVLFEK